MSKKNRTVIKTTSIIFSFFVSIFVFLSAVFLIFNSSIFSYRYAVNHLTKSGYYTTLAKEIETEFISLGAASHFDSSLFENIIPKECIEDSVNQYVNSIYSGSDSAVDTTKIRSTLHDAFIKYANDNNIDLTNETTAAIMELEDECIQIYSDYVGFSFSSQISDYLVNSKTTSYTLATIFIILSLALMVVIYIINFWHHKAIRFYIYAISSSILMLIPIPIAAFLSHKIEKINIASKSLYNFAVLYLNDIINYYVYAIIALLIILLFLIFIYIQQRNSALKHHRDT